MDMQPCPIGSLPAGIKKNKLGGVAMANERLLALRKRMAEEGIDAYYVPTSDFHDSEYVEPYFGCRQFLSGFTGSAGDKGVFRALDRRTVFCPGKEAAGRSGYEADGNGERGRSYHF